MSVSLISFTPGTLAQSASVNANFAAVLAGVLVLDGSGNAITGLCKIANGGGFEGNSDSGDRIGIGTHGTSSDIEIMSHAHNARLCAGGASGSSSLIEWNVYNDGTNDRYITTTTSPGAYQWSVSSSGIRYRKSTDASPTAGSTITWGSYTNFFV